MQPFHKAQSQEKENWTRLSYLLIDQGTRCIRQKIIDKLDEWQLEFKVLVNGNKRKIGSCKIFYEHQKKLLLTNTQNDVIEKCDLTLLIRLVSFFKMLPIPPCGWHSMKEPDPSHLDPSSDVLRLRFMRNALYHSVQCAIPQEDFEKRWTEGTEILRRLNAKQSAMDKIKPRKFEMVERRYYVKVIRVQFSSDRPEAEEFIKKKIKEEHLIAMPRPGLNMGDQRRCTGCNKPVNNMCNDCSNRQSGSKPKLGMGETCTKCNRQMSRICSHCTDGHQPTSKERPRAKKK